MSDKDILFLMMDMPIVRKGQMALDKNLFLDPRAIAKSLHLIVDTYL